MQQRFCEAATEHDRHQHSDVCWLQQTSQQMTAANMAPLPSTALPSRVCVKHTGTDAEQF
jgi:hypothetical protein